MFHEYDVVRLRMDLRDPAIPTGSVGTILIVYPDVEPAYEVEFMDNVGRSLGCRTLREKDLIREI